MEFFVIITQKVENPIDVMMAKDIVYDFIKSERWTIIDRDADTFLSAIELVSEFDIHLWDAAIAASMKENNLTEIVTENEKDFRKVPDIKVVFPF
jgi:predicted nucleic acid-binding protein